MNTSILIIFYIIGSVFAIALYMIPAFIAYKRKHPQFIPILVIDLFFGWSGIAWVGMLAWSLWSFSKKDA